MKHLTTTLRRATLAAALLALGSHAAAARGGQFDVVDSTAGAPSERNIQTLHAPWFFIGDDFHAIVAVKNCSDRDVAAVMTVRFGSDATTDGSYEVPGPIRVAAGRVALVDLRELHDAAPDVFGASRSGGLELTFVGEAADLLASVTMTSIGSHLSFDVPFADPHEARSERLDGTWWFAGPDYEAFVEMKNTSASPVTATLALTFGERGRVTRDFEIPAHQARAVGVADFGEELGGAMSGSAEISHTGAPGALVAQITTISVATGIAHGAAFRARPAAKPSARPLARPPVLSPAQPLTQPGASGPAAPAPAVAATPPAP